MTEDIENLEEPVKLSLKPNMDKINKNKVEIWLVLFMFFGMVAIVIMALTISNDYNALIIEHNKLLADCWNLN